MFSKLISLFKRLISLQNENKATLANSMTHVGNAISASMLTCTPQMVNATVHAGVLDDTKSLKAGLVQQMISKYESKKKNKPQK